MSSTSLQVIHTIAALKSSHGGPSRTVTALCSELGKRDILVEIVTQKFRSSQRDNNLIPPTELVHTTLLTAIHLPCLRIGYAPSFQSTLIERCRHLNARLIHDHGIWLPTNHATAVIAFQLGIPMIVSPRGMLEPWSLRYKNWKKRLAWYLYQHGDLLTAQLFHITALQEAKSLRDLGFRQPIALIPNGVEVPNWCSRPKPQTELRTALFLSRIHPVKGLLELIKAWATVRPSHWQVVIAGPDECGHQKSVEKAVNEAGLQGVFSFIGEVEGEAKTKLYCQADLFILPTFSESFGVVVAEALACGVPVITTKGAPWKELITHRCGWWVDIGVEPLADAIRAATMLSDTERYAMGKRGRQFVECNFGWSHIAEQMISVYRWMVGQGGKPECVITD